MARGADGAQPTAAVHHRGDDHDPAARCPPAGGAARWSAPRGRGGWPRAGVGPSPAPGGPMSPALLTSRSTRSTVPASSSTATPTESRDSRSRRTTRGAGPAPAPTMRSAASSALLHVAAGEHNLGAQASQRRGRGEAEPAVGAGDHGHRPSRLGASARLQLAGIRCGRPGCCRAVPPRSRRRPGGSLPRCS